MSNRTEYNVSDTNLQSLNDSYSLLVGGLHPCTLYSFAVRALTGGAEGVVSPAVSRRTGVQSTLDLSFYCNNS